MPTTSIAVRLDGVEFSRYYEPLRRITAVVTATGAANGVIATARLVREDGYGTVSTKTGTIASEKATIVFDLAADCNDASGIYRGRQGKYHVALTVSDNVTTGKSASFDVMVVSARELRDLYLNGLDLKAGTVMSAREQPKNITGVTVNSASSGQSAGIFTLTYTFSGQTLSWDGGVAVAIDPTLGVQNLLLVNAGKSAYLDVTAVISSLPTSNKTDSLIIDYRRIDDSMMRQWLTQAYGFVQSRLAVKVEPNTIDTDPVEYADVKGEPQTFYRHNWAQNWFSIQFTHPWLLKVEKLLGFFNSSQSFTINVDEWIVRNQMAGAIEFVPKQGAITSFQFTGVPSFAYMEAFASIPNFWHYRLVAGLPDLDGDEERGRVRTAIARLAAIDALALAGQMANPGLASESVSRDGISESRTYAHGKGGIYGESIDHHRTFLFGDPQNENDPGELASLRKKLLGFRMVIL